MDPISQVLYDALLAYIEASKAAGVNPFPECGMPHFPPPFENDPVLLKAMPGIEVVGVPIGYPVDSSPMGA